MNLQNLKNRSDIIELTENFFFIQAPSKGRFPFCNGFLITGKNKLLIDAGLGYKKIKEIDDEIRIDALIISHSHPDHISGWHLLKDRYFFYPNETPNSVGDLYEMGYRFTGNSQDGKYWQQNVVKILDLKPMRKPDSRFGDGYLFDTGCDVQLEAIYAPGHLEDHYCFFDRNSGVLLTTDIDFTSFGPWYANEEGSIEKFQESIKRVMKLPHLKVCSSHKPPTDSNKRPDMFQAYMDMFIRQKNDILRLCDLPITLEELTAASPLYKNQMFDKTLQTIFEKRMIQKNLVLLIQDGIVEESAGLYRKL